MASGAPEVTLRVHYGEIPEVDLGDKIFDSGGPWSLYRCGHNTLIPVVVPPPGSQLERLAVFDDTFSSGELFISSEQNRFPELSAVDIRHAELDTGAIVDPFRYPLDELLMINFLAKGRGVIVHALGVDDQGHGLAFLGVSGAGKSTLAELWKETTATLLSDDRLIIRRRRGRFLIYGTPWHGDAKICAPQHVALEKLFFLEHAPENHIQPLSSTEVLTRLLVRCFPPFYDRAGMEYTLTLLSRLAQEIPGYELGFAPDKRVIDFVRGMG